MAIFSRLKRAKPPKTEVVTKTPKTDCEVVTFSRLDYWSMLDLFDRIPVHDLVRLNGLSSWWSGYVTKVCRTKRDITVQCGDKSDQSTTDDETQDQFNLLKVTSIHSQTSDRLGQLLPSITSLEIIIDGPQCHDIADITHLISQWSHQLVNLKIKCQFDSAQVPEETENRQMQFKQLLLSLNTITSLRRLSIKCKWWKCSPMQDPIDLTILSQLEYFYFKTGQYDFVNLRNSLVQYAGPNRHLKQIELPSLIWSHRRNDLLEEHQLLSKLTMLKLGDSPTRDHWALLPNLTTVDLGYIQSRSEFMEAITGMQCLKLIHNLKMLVFHDFDFDQVLIDLPQLPSVTNFKLVIVANLFTNPYQTVKYLQLHIIFPNVEFVYLAIDPKCTTSSYRVVKWMAKIRNKITYRMFKLRVRLAFG